MSTDCQVTPVITASDVRTDLPTRAAKVKWVLVVDASLGPGFVANAAVCLGATVGNAAPALLGPGGRDASGQHHPGLPWTGCPVLAGDAEAIRTIRAKAVAREDIFVADMPKAAQTSRVYDEYLASLAETGEDALGYHAVSLAGPRNKIDKLVGKLPLLR